MSNEPHCSTADANVESVREKMRQRAEVGLHKYGVTTERGDLSTLEWLKHAQEEAMDLAVYLERLIRDEEMKQLQAVFAVQPNPECACSKCNPKAWWMVVCAACGNKRCPHANDHENPCTGSNDPGQPGSAFQ